MSDTKVTTVTFEPNTLGVYVDGELYESGDKYMETEILGDLLESDIEVDEFKTRHYYIDRWEGMPDTLEKAEELYRGE
jgi:hypothetical protein